MSKQNLHPGEYLSKLLEKKKVNQRELAAKIDVAHSLLSNILKGHRNVNVNLALALEAAGFKTADYWLEKQMKFSLQEAKKGQDYLKKKSHIEIWNKIEEEKLIPLSYLKKQSFLGIESSEHLDKIFKLYDVKDLGQLEQTLNNYNLSFFRKSSKFAEDRNNVIAWSVVAEEKARTIKVGQFNKEQEESLIMELKKCFYDNTDTLKKTEKILHRYGIKFFLLDRPSKTPVEGKSFISDQNPAIGLTLKYKRLDNFAFTLLHELGHVFLHLSKEEYKNADFFINNANMKVEEFEADNYAKEKLIKLEDWNEFILSNDHYSDSVIYDFAKRIKVHPGIIRGRVCFENPEYYRKRTSITAENQLN